MLCHLQFIIRNENENVRHQLILSFLIMSTLGEAHFVIITEGFCQWR